MRVLFVDIETGGIDAEDYSILQIAMAVYDTALEKVLSELSFFIKEDPYRVSSKAMELNKIDLSLVTEEGFTRKEAVEQIIEFIQANFKERAVIASHNVTFDRNFLYKLFKDFNLPYYKYINHRMIDTMSIAFILRDSGILPYTIQGSNDLIEFFNIDIEKKFNATLDIYLTIEIYKNLRQLLKKINPDL